MPPTPSPEPQLIQLVGASDGAPWFGDAVVAGSFLLLGAILAFAFNLIQDKRRATQERTNALTEELLEFAAELITLGSKFAGLGQKSLVAPLADFLPELIEENTKLLAQHSILFTRFRLVMPQSIQKTVVAYSAACISLTLPPFDEKTMTPRLNNYIQSEQALVNDLRRLRGLTDLKTSGDLDPHRKRTDFADRATDQFIKAMTDNGIEMEDGPKKPRQ
ncbi:hypothetical protein [Microbacterium sp. NPDC079176]|uniref:hypothetical protein n=1 Tax=Microbacterium sp. NPDC079176 TaxID=3154768 RepID=UPI00341DC4C5